MTKPKRPPKVPDHYPDFTTGLWCVWLKEEVIQNIDDGALYSLKEKEEILGVWAYGFYDGKYEYEWGPVLPSIQKAYELYVVERCLLGQDDTR